jgi:hypothetical protein
MIFISKLKKPTTDDTDYTDGKELSQKSVGISLIRVISVAVLLALSSYESSCESTYISLTICFAFSGA